MTNAFIPSAVLLRSNDSKERRNNYSVLIILSQLRKIIVPPFRSLFILGVLCFNTQSKVHSADFAKDIEPIFQKHCHKCHGPRKQKSDFRLDLRATALKGTAIVPGDAKSQLLKFVKLPEGDEHRMPPEGDGLSTAEIATLEEWISQGANWPDSHAGRDARLDYWAWEPLQEKFEQRSIDGFLDEALQTKGLKMSSPPKQLAQSASLSVSTTLMMVVA